MDQESGMATEHWIPPAPRGGLAGVLDKFVGPGATRAELWLQFAGAAVIAVLCFGFYWGSAALSDPLRIVVVALLAFDIGGGVITNATSSAKRWYHRTGQTPIRHMGFVALHVVQLGLVAWLFAPQPWLYLGASYALLLAVAALVLAVPLYLQRPVAFAAYGCCFLATQLPLFTLEGLGWFLPLLYFKLLVSHLVRETPFRPASE